MWYHVGMCIYDVACLWVTIGTVLFCAYALLAGRRNRCWWVFELAMHILIWPYLLACAIKTVYFNKDK